MACGNLANKLMGLTMCLLCTATSIYFWWMFDQLPLVGGPDATGPLFCDSADGRTQQTCQARAATGALAALGGLVALCGLWAKDPVRNEATVASAFALLNLAMLVFFYDTWDGRMVMNGDEMGYCKDQEWDFKPCSIWITSGVLYSVGFLCGIVHSLCSCCKESIKNNILYVAAMFVYCLAYSQRAWYWFDEIGCSRDDLKNDIQNTDQLYESTKTQCTQLGFSAGFALVGAGACLLAGVIACCKGEGQARFQNMTLIFSIGLMCAAWTTEYWYRYANPFMPGVSCSISDPRDSKGDTYCRVMGVGGAVAALGIPVCLLGVVAFCCGCANDGEEDNDDYNTTYGV